MNGIWYYIVAFIIIWAGALIFKNKLTNYGFEIEFPMIMWKTSRLQGIIDKIANISPKFWKWFMNIGIVISFGSMILMSYTLIDSLKNIIDAPAVSIVLPGVDIPGSPISVPLVAGLLALATVLIVHEFSHGILSRVEKINIKSIGLMLFAILPGAFVEPDEEQLSNSGKISKLRVYAAGSMANLSLAAIALIITMLISSFAIPCLFDENGIEISKVMEDSPSSGVLKEGMIIESIDNVPIKDSNDYMDIVYNFKPNNNLTIVTDDGPHVIKLAENPSNHSRGYVGIQVSKNYFVKDSVSDIVGNQIPWVLFSLVDLFKWIFILNFGVGLFNLLPIKPLDGGHMFEILLSYRLKENQYKPLVKTVSYFFAIIIIFSICYSFIAAI